MRSKRWSLYFLLIILLPFILFWRWVFKGEVLYWGALLFQFWPWRQLVKTSLLAGEWPLWNPLLGNGVPLLANLQSAVFYPPNLLYLVLPVAHGLTLSVGLHLALAGVFMYLYTRHLGLHPFAATLSALTYMFSGYLVGRTQFVTMINAAAWIPLSLLLGEKLTETALLKGPQVLDIIWLGLAWSMPLLAGHAQLWFYSLWLSGAYTLFRSWQKAKEQRSEGARERESEKARERSSESASQRISDSTNQDVRARRSSSPWGTLIQAGWRLSLAIGLALLLSAGQLLPTAELTLESARNSGAERTFALTYSFWPWRLVTLLAPDFFGHPARHNYWGYANFWEDHAYVGVLPFLLALVAIWRYLRATVGRRAAGDDQAGLSFRRQRYSQVVPFFATIIPLSLILAMGWNTPIYLWVFDHVPGFGYFQAPARLLIWYTIALAVLAGVGAQIFSSTNINRRLWQYLLVIGIGITSAGVAGTLIVEGRSQTFVAATLTFGVWFVLSTTLLLARPKPVSQPKQIRRFALWQWSVLALVAINLLWAAWPLIPTLSADIFSQPIASADVLKRQPAGYRFFVDKNFDYTTKFNQYYRFDTFGPPELEHWQRLRESLVPNIGIYAGLPSANNDDPLVIRRWQQLTNLLEQAAPADQTRLLSLMNVGYYLTTTGTGIGPPVQPGEAWTIYRVFTALPRAYFVPKGYWAEDETEAISRLTSPDFDSHQEVVIMRNEAESTVPIAAHAESIQPTYLKNQAGDTWPVSVDEQSPGQILLTVEAPASGFVVLTDTFYPGWHVTLDGRPTPIYQANLAFRAVAVEAGKHEIIFRYQPRSFTIGLLISAMTILVMVIIGGFLIRNLNTVGQN